MKRTIAYILALAALCSCGQGVKKSGSQTAAFEEKIPVVKTVVAQVQQVPQDQTYSATVQANVINNIAPQSANRIRKINVDVADFVKAGQILAEMDRINLDQAALRLANEEVEFERLKSLYAKGGISQSDFEARELSFKVNKSSYENLKENTILRSPVDGVVTVRNYDVGDMYAMASPIFVVQQITPVKLLVGVSESDYAKVNKGDKVTITAEALPGKTFEGTVSKVYPTIDPATHTVNVEVKVPNKDRQLRPGMYANVNILFSVNNSVVVPDIAVVKQQGSGVRSVYVLQDDGTVHNSVVTLGRHIGEEYEILSGVEPGQTIVVKGISALRDGIKVQVQE